METFMEAVMKKRDGRKERIAGFLFFGVWMLIGIIAPGMASAATETQVTQLNITGGSIDLNLVQPGSINGNFSKDGVLAMGGFQSPSEVFPSSLPMVDGHTLSFFTASGGGVLPPPSAEVNGTAMTADLSSLFVDIAGSKINGSLNIGGMASGTYDPETGAFSLHWTHVYDTLSWTDIALGGKVADCVTPVPIPPAVFLFGAGLLSLVGLFRERDQDSDAVIA
jgi:hypothetical protein